MHLCMAFIIFFSFKNLGQVLSSVMKKSSLGQSLKGQYHGRSMGDIMIFGHNSLNLNFEHYVN